MQSYPFESKNTGTAANPVWDRAITAEMERAMRSATYTNGVFATPANSLMVEAASGMTVNVNPGMCNINGAVGNETAVRQFTLSTAHPSLPRIDRIVARFDTAEAVRSIELYLKEGSPATTPVPPERVTASNYYELVLADIRVPAGADEITNSFITDRRGDSDYCGLVLPAIPYEEQADQLWQQISDSIDLVESALDGTTAGNLQSRISAVEAVVDEFGDAAYSNMTLQAMRDIGYPG